MDYLDLLPGDTAKSQQLRRPVPGYNVGVMQVPILCLVAFAGWVVVLVSAIGVVRVMQVLQGKVPANGFPSGTPHGAAAYWRLNRAHQNTLESLPVFAALVLSAAVLGAQGELLDRLCLAVLAARIVQSLVHIAGGSNAHVNVRFSFFLVQLVCFVWIGLIVVATLI